MQALRHFLLDAFQTLSTLVILRQGLRGYHPRTLGMFSFSLTPWRQWRLPLLAGCITFPAIGEESGRGPGTYSQVVGAGHGPGHAHGRALLPCTCTPAIPT